MHTSWNRFVVYLGTLLLLLGCAAPSAFAQSGGTIDQVKKRGTLRIGWATWFPYAYMDPKTKQVVGFSVDLGKEMADSLEVKVEFVEDSWATLVAGLQANKYDVAIPMGITLRRAVAVTYSKPFIAFTETFMVPKSEVGKYSNWRDLDKPGMKITTTMGSTSEVFLKKALVNAELILTKDGASSLNQVLTGRAHAIANTNEAFKKIMQERSDVAVISGPPYGRQPVAYVVRQGDYHFRDWINYFLDEERQTGALAKILKKHGMDDSYLQLGAN